MDNADLIITGIEPIFNTIAIMVVLATVTWYLWRANERRKNKNDQ